jgi:hypothetical protein
MKGTEMVYCIEEKGKCRVHGADWPCTTNNVLEDVAHERERQFRQYGDNASHEDGTGPETRWCLPVSSNSAEKLEIMFRENYEDYQEETGDVTWVHLVLEEVAEAFKETDSVRLEEELIQLAALAVCWVEKIRERREWGVQVGLKGYSGGARVVIDLDWRCPADVMRGTHGFGTGPYVVVYRDPGEDWKEWGS